MAATFVFLRGAPGVGKTTVGRIMLNQLRGGAVLEVDRFRAMLGGCDWSDRRQHQVALSAAIQAARDMASQAVYPVIVIDTFCRDRVAVARRMLPEGARDIVLSLWAHPGVLGARLEQREGGFRDWDQARIMNGEVASVRLDREAFLDTSPLGAEAVAEWALTIVLEGVHDVGAR
jgi:predicted kinase